MTASALLGVRCKGDAKDGFSFFGERGLRDGSFLRPRAIAARNGLVHVIDTSGRFQTFDGDGKYLSGFMLPESELGTPTAISFRLDGAFLIPDTHYSRVLEYSASGELLLSWGEYGDGPDQFVYPTGVVQAPDGKLFISEYGVGAERVRSFGPDRKQILQWGAHGSDPGKLNRAMAIGRAGDGTILVVDTANHRVQAFTENGELIRIMGGPGEGEGKLRFPHDLSIGPDGTVCVCEYGSHRVSRFGPKGDFIASYGSPGRGPGEFNGPRGVAVSEENVVYVADTDNHRVQYFKVEAL